MMNKKILKVGVIGAVFGFFIIIALFLLGESNVNRTVFDLIYYTVGLPYVIATMILISMGLVTSPYILYAIILGVLLYSVLIILIYLSYRYIKELNKKKITHILPHPPHL